MSNVARVAGQAANTLVKPLSVEEVFSTYLYEGNGAGEGTVMQTIENGIDLDSEGGMVWIKSRSSRDHNLQDTERGIASQLSTNTTDAATGFTNRVSAFNSNGFDLDGNVYVNANNEDYASWTFRKAPKFFDVVTYTGNGSTQTISHNLGSVPGTVIVKKTNSSANWIVYHRSLGNDKAVFLNLTSSQSSSTTYWNATTPTSSVFSVGANSNTNGNGDTFVAYLFAHNDDDGEFGPDGDADIIKCGSYSGQATVDLGFEPQWLLVKQTGATSSWRLVDNMRGWGMGDADLFLAPDRSDAELTSQNWIDITPTGFKVTNSNANVAGTSMIYIAIRRGPMAVPEDADDVFDIHLESASAGTYTNTTGWPVDLQLQTARTTGIHRPYDRLRGGAKYLDTASTNQEQSGGTAKFDNNTGYTNSTSLQLVDWLWRRAPNYFDIVAYSGNGTAGRTVSHNLGVAPEMMWVKRRSTTGEWAVYHSGVDASAPEDYYLLLSATNARATSTTVWNDTAPTSDVFSLGTIGWVNASGHDYIAYLFASLDGISKVGSFTSDGTDMTIDCGFTSGARFVLLKKTNASDDWFVWDTERGIVTGNDKRIKLNDTSAEATGADNIDPDNSGFIINNNILGGSGNTFIFYAIA